MKRRERTRHMIALGGLVQKAGLVDLADDDRAILYGAFLTVADKLRGDDREQALLLWRRKGRRAFEAEAAEKAARVRGQVDGSTSPSYISPKRSATVAAEAATVRRSSRDHHDNNAGQLWHPQSEASPRRH